MTDAELNIILRHLMSPNLTTCKIQILTEIQSTSVRVSDLKYNHIVLGVTGGVQIFSPVVSQCLVPDVN